MKRRTTITLTIAGLLTLAGIFYAACPPGNLTISPGLGPVGVGASTTNVIVTEYCTQKVDTIDCNGNVSLLATIPAPDMGCVEKYVAVVPIQGLLAVPPWSPRDIFVTEGNQVYKLSGGSATLFATIPGCTGDHGGITFDHVGTFGHNMIVTCVNGQVSEVNSIGAVVFSANAGTELEGPAVAALTFGPLGGQILTSDEDTGKVWAISNTGVVTDAFTVYGIGNFGAESVHVIPDAPCTFCSSAFFSARYNFDQIIDYPPGCFAGLGGDILIPSEFGGGMARFHWNGSMYEQSLFDNTPGQFEGSSFVDCDIPTPTPTSTPTATATATATFTPTATATFTPTATATFTPTGTATATATATATPTPTPTPPGNVSKITPTGTTCSQFRNGTADTLLNLNYSVSNGKIKNNVTPGVFFYWVSVTLPAGNNSVTITQTITTGNFNTLFNFTSGSQVFNANCGSVSDTITQNTNTGTVTVSFNAPTAGTYIIGIKYDSKSIVGATAPTPPTIHYNFETTGVPGSISGLDVIKN